MKLNLGSGPDYRRGYINVEADERLMADVHADILEYEPGQPVEEIYLKHVLEHQLIDAVPMLLRKFYAWLVPGGKLIVDGPDLKAMARRIALKDPWNWDDVRMIYGGQDSPWDVHRAGWSPEFLAHLMRDAGFTRTEIVNVDLCAIVTGTK